MSLLSSNVPVVADDRPTPKKHRMFYRQPGWRKRWPLALLIGSTMLTVIVVVLLLTPWIAPHDPATQDLLRRLEGPSSTYWLGTDHLGRDLFTRILYGGRFSVTIAAVALVLASTIGTVLGVAAAIYRGPFDELVTRVADVLLAFPEMVVAVLIVAIMGPSQGTLVFALVIAGWTPFARLARGVAIEISAREFVEAARALGCSMPFIIFRHVMPNAMAPLLAHAALRFGHMLITVGALSFLGLGVQPPDADWGAMLSEAQPYMTRQTGLMVYPGLAVFVTALSVTLIGQGINSRSRR